MYGGIGHIFLQYMYGRIAFMCARIAFTCSRIAFTCVHYSEYMRTYSLLRAHVIVNTCARIHLYVHMH